MPDSNNQPATEPSPIASEPACPVGEPQCLVIDEVLSLRREVVRLADQNRSDSLTGLFNYRHLREVLNQELERTRRSGQPTALIMVDLDHFKQINDRWGHEAGNRVLASTADVLQHEVRRLDSACRYGGEEFAVVLPATGVATATQVAERIRHRIAACAVPVEETAIPLTASLGVDIYCGPGEESPEQFLARTDACLYRAKQQGRNRVCHAATEERSTVSREERDMLSDLFGGDG